MSDAHHLDEADTLIAPDAAVLQVDPATAVLAVHADAVALHADAGGGARRLAFGRVADIAEHAVLASLARADGSPVLLAVSGASERPPVQAAAGVEMGSLRAIGAALAPAERSLAMRAVALGRWLSGAPFCPACGTRTELRGDGWARRCPSCRREHFPRTDPAVIVAVADAADERLLLGRNVRSGDRPVYSTFAGFVEAGESAEETIARELAEEAGIAVTDVRYHASQPWPYPRSLMLGYHARVVDPGAARPDGTEIVDLRWFDRAELRAALAGEAAVLLPGPASIAHALITAFVERGR